MAAKDQEITFDGMTVGELLTKVVNATGKAEAATIVGSWLMETGSRVARKFSYKAAFPRTDATTATKFVRTSNHHAWRDGEDLVQAEQTATEDGFNLRFYRIEADLDALNADAKTLFSSLAAMRANLADRLDDIKVELNLINADLARLQACCDEHDLPQLEGADLRNKAKLIGVTNFFGKKMIAYKAGDGIFVAPHITGGPGNPRVKHVVDVARLLATTPELAAFLGAGPRTKEELQERFGTLEISEGVTFGAVLDILPTRARFNSATALISGISERQAAVIRSEGAVDEVLAIELGFDDVERVASTSLERFDAVPGAVRAGKLTLGISTHGELAGRSAEELTPALQREGYAVEPGEVAGWIAGAGVLGMVR